MTRPLRIAAAVALGLATAAPAWADPPEIKSLSPLAVRKGEAVELAIGGSNLAGHPHLVAPIPVAVDPASADSTDAGTWKFRLTVPADVPLGAYPIRVRTDDGISNPFLLTVGQLPSVPEKEENSTFEQAQAIATPAAIEGQAAGNDVDFFRFAGRKGQRIVVDAQCARVGSGVDPTIRLTTAARGFVASADDSPGLLTDARLTAVLPEDGEYVVELSDTRYQGGDRPVYRLVIGELPVADEVYPLGGRGGETVGFELRGGTLPDLRVGAATLPLVADGGRAPLALASRALGLGSASDPPWEVESLPPIALGRLPELREPADPSAPPVRAAAPVVFNGRIDPAGDEDRFVVSVAPGQRLRFRVDAASLGSALDGQLQVLNPKGASLANADDANLPPILPPRQGQQAEPIVSPDPSLDFTVPGGQTEVVVALRDLEGRGGVGFPYRLTVAPIAPTFEVLLDDGQVSVPRGGTVAVRATIRRQGYNGPITLAVADPPPGLTVRPGQVAEGQTAGLLTVSAAADASFGAVTLRVEGRGEGPDAPTAAAEKPVVFAKQGNLPTNYLFQDGLVAAPAQPGPVALDAPAGPIEVAHGYGAPVAVKASRTPGADGALTLKPLPLPKGFNVPDAKIDEKAAEGTVTVNAGTDAPLGPTTVGLTAKGKFGDKDRTLAVPAVTVLVVRPAAVELAAPSAEVKAGTTVEVKGKLVRKGPFREPVTVRLDGLPAGLKAEPVTVAPDASEFTLKVVADPSAVAATANANVALAFQVNKKDYSTPPTPISVKVAAAK